MEYTKLTAISVTKPKKWKAVFGAIYDEDGELIVGWNGIDSAFGQPHMHAAASRLVRQHNRLVAVARRKTVALLELTP